MKNCTSTKTKTNFVCFRKVLLVLLTTSNLLIRSIKSRRNNLSKRDACRALVQPNPCKSFHGDVTHARSEVSRTRGLILPCTMGPIRKTRSRERERIDKEGRYIARSPRLPVFVLLLYQWYAAVVSVQLRGLTNLSIPHYSIPLFQFRSIERLATRSSERAPLIWALLDSAWIHLQESQA